MSPVSSRVLATQNLEGKKTDKQTVSESCHLLHLVLATQNLKRHGPLEEAISRRLAPEVPGGGLGGFTVRLRGVYGEGG